MGTLCTPYYDNQYPVFSRQSGAVNTNMAIQHPDIFYFVLDANWSSTNNLEYWNKGNMVTTNNNNSVYKTIYSSSPTNFIEPHAAAFTGFSTTGGNTWNLNQFNVNGSYSKGWNFYSQPNATGGTVFFSALGFRDAYSGRVNTSNGGAVANVSSDGDYWSAGPSGTPTSARDLYFYSGYVNPQGGGMRAFGCTIRSVSE